MSFAGIQKQQLPQSSSVLGNIFAPQMEVDDDIDIGKDIEKDEESGVTLEYVQRLESEINDKNKEIQKIKEKLTNNSTRRASPVFFLIFTKILGLQSNS